jgi:HEAT repeat protein
LFLLAAGMVSTHGEVGFLKGKVHYLDQAGTSIQQRLTAAEKEFAATEKSGFYFTGYIFDCRHSIHMGDKDTEVSFTVKKKSDEIKIRRRSQSREDHGYSMHTENEQGGPAGLVILHEFSRGKSRILDTTLLDLDDTYDFAEEPMYWLGEADTKESFDLLRKAFETGAERTQSELLFALGAHDTPEVGGFLKKTALGPYPRKVRKNAIFWIGNLEDRKSFEDLKEIYRKVESTELKKQVVFAFTLTDEEDAIHEMIRIARNEDKREVRKNAIFWLGQKASKEATKALTEVVEGSDEDDDVKKSAVFALSQLPSDQSVPLLIKIAKTNKSSSVRKNAIFWLGQTDDEEALKFFEDILLKK